MALPFLPGNVFSKTIGKERFHKSHYLKENNCLPYTFGIDKPGIGGAPLPGQRIDPPTSFYPIGDGSHVPAWVAFDKQVLCFDAYFQEAVHECRTEQYRVRRCQIFFYLEDDTMQICEQRTKNSALPQGTLLRRHRCLKPPPNGNMFYTVHDLNVGIDLVLYGRTYRLVACDPFTHNFLRKLGVRVNEPEPIPEDPYSNVRLAEMESMRPLRPYERRDKLRQFLDHDKHVLRFFCFWDDSDTLYGDAREYVLTYFLSDDTIEIREIIPENAGRDNTPCFLRRQKLTKGLFPMPLPGAITDVTLLNTMGNAQKHGPMLVDNTNIGKPNIEYYTDKELTIGGVVNVYGRKFLICDCDAFTKEYYRNKYGITSFNPVAVPKAECDTPLLNKIPPYNGWGTDEDSMGNCNALVPVPPQKDFKKFMEKDTCGLESHVLRFSARLKDDNPLNKCRCFIISCFLVDDTFLIFEPPIANSGFKGGKFIERQKVMKPGQERFRTKLPNYYSSLDVYIGAVLTINEFQFEICGADDYAFSYMERHPAEYPFADKDKILMKLRPLVQGREEELRKFTAGQDPENRGSIDYSRFEHLIQSIVKDPRYDPICIVPHEIATLARFYADRNKQDMNYMAIIGLAQQQLRKENFEAFAELSDACRYEDVGRTGSMKQSDLRRICRANRFPLFDDILLTLMEISQNFDNGLVYYESFINQLNWRCNPVPPGTVPCEYSGNLEVDWYSLVTGMQDKMVHTCNRSLTDLGVERVSYKNFIEDVCNAAECT